MPLDQFTDEAYEGLAAGKDQVPVGMGKAMFDKFELKRQEEFKEFNKMMAGVGSGDSS